MEIVPTSLFQRRTKKLLDAKSLLALSASLEADPLQGDVIPGLGGVRKMRFALPGRGKRGGMRVVYFYLHSRDVIFLLTGYAKNAKGDLSPEDRKVLRTFVDQLEDMS